MKPLRPNVPVMGLYWRFIIERQRVWQRRTVEKQTPPWTADAVLAGHSFTNVYRELDPGTQFAIEFILQREAPAHAKLFNLMVYRLIGKEETMERMGFLDPFTFTMRDMVIPLQAIRDEGGVPFTSAYMVCGYGQMGYGDKVKNVAALTENLAKNFKTVWEQVCAAPSREAAHAVLMQNYGWGRFLAYQVLVDAGYPFLEPGTGPQPWSNVMVRGERSLLPWGNLGWCTFGPGAEAGAKLLFRDVGRRDEQRVADHLVAAAREVLPAFGFPYLVDQDGNRWDLDNATICNTLCEFSKFARYKTESRAGRGRLFEPAESYKRDRIARGYGRQRGLFDESDGDDE